MQVNVRTTEWMRGIVVRSLPSRSPPQAGGARWRASLRKDESPGRREGMAATPTTTRIPRPSTNGNADAGAVSSR